MTELFNSNRFSSFLGTLFLVLAAGTACLMFVDRWTTIKLNLPGFWYRSRNLHLVFCMSMFVLSWWFHRLTESLHDDTGVVIKSVRMYSKPNCELCDRALDVLGEFKTVLPLIEQIDITGNEELERQHSESVPVIEIDGRIRFRGIVSEELLQRLIDARRRQLIIASSTQSENENQV